MKIICAGYWKTGTKSLAAALRILGYKVYDFDDQIFELGDLWDKFFNGTVTDEEIYSSLKDVDVVIDGPTVGFWEEIHKVFPDAKIIFTIRDEESWYQSYRGWQSAISMKLKLQMCISFLFQDGRDFHRRHAATLQFCQGIDPPLLAFNSENDRLQKLKFRKHNSYVIHRVPKALIHEAKDGWCRLCEFLQCDVPDEPYPHKNKKSSLLTVSFKEGSANQKFLRLLRQTEIILYIILVALPALALCLLYWYIYC